MAVVPPAVMVTVTVAVFPAMLAAAVPPVPVVALAGVPVAAMVVAVMTPIPHGRRAMPMALMIVMIRAHQDADGRWAAEKYPNATVRTCGTAGDQSQNRSRNRGFANRF